jgi:hypothetical protein
MTVWIYDQGEDLKVFATEEVAQAWIDENDPEGVAFEYEVMGQRCVQIHLSLWRGSLCRWSRSSRLSSSFFFATSLAVRTALTKLWTSHNSSIDLLSNCSRYTSRAPQDCGSLSLRGLRSN